MTEKEAWALLELLLRMPPEKRRLALIDLAPPALRRIAEHWFWQAHGGQREPKGDWRIWLNMAGRGFGKTRAGAEWIWARARELPGAQIALVGGKLAEVFKVMIKGPSGLIATAGSDERPIWVQSDRLLRLPGGAEAHAYSAERPEALRGPEHDFAWCDELAKWRNADSTWDNLMLGLRRGERPRALVTTTPRPVPLLRRIRALERVAETGGRSVDNVHLCADFLAAMDSSYGGLRIGRQELDGELIDDIEGALWPRDMIEDWRAAAVAPEEAASGDCRLRRIVIGVDPPGSAAGTCGISVCGLGEDGVRYVLADASESGLSPAGWARAVARAAERWGADRVVAEANHGGDMVKEVLKAAAPELPLRLVHASRGKAARAEPIAALFENEEAKFAGRFPALEDELAGLTTGGAYQGPGSSPDRADAMVWAMTELIDSRPRGPRLVGL